MKRRLTLAVMLALTAAIPTGAQADPEDDLSIKVLKVERSGRDSFVLFEVKNDGPTPYDFTEWSCVFSVNGEPVHEESSYIEKVPAHGKAVRRQIQSYNGAGKVDCRFIQAIEKI